MPNISYTINYKAARATFDPIPRHTAFEAARATFV